MSEQAPQFEQVEAERQGFMTRMAESAQLKAAIIGATVFAAMTPELVSPASESAQANVEKSKSDITESSIRGRTNKVLNDNLISYEVGYPTRFSPFFVWVKEGTPNKLTVKPLTTTIDSNADCDKSNTQQFRNVYTRPNTGSSPKSDTEIVFEQCDKSYGSTLFLLDEDGLSSSMDRQVGGYVAKKLGIKDSKHGDLKRITLKPHKSFAKLIFQKTNHNSVKSIKINSEQKNNPKINITKYK